MSLFIYQSSKHICAIFYFDQRDSGHEKVYSADLVSSGKALKFLSDFSDGSAVSSTR
jgi:hypothetical protein